MPLQRRLLRLRTPIPQGYILGRVDEGEGDIQLLTFAEITGPQALALGALANGENATDVPYDNSTTSLTATEVQAALDEIATAFQTTKVTAGAPYTNDGYIEVVIGGTTVRLMTTA